MGVVSTGQITIVDMNDVTISTSQPLSPNVDQLWLDTSTVPNQLKRWDGTSWIVVNDATGINEDLDNLDQRLVELSNSTSETVEEFKRTVSATYINTTDFGAYQTEVNSKFSQTVEGFNFEWNTLKTAIETVDTNATEEFNDIRKYIRFIDGKMVLGEESNALTLEVRNNMIVFLHGDTPVAYFDNNKLYVTEGEFTVSLKIGKFAFTPRTNGNLSFGKVV